MRTYFYGGYHHRCDRHMVDLMSPEPKKHIRVFNLSKHEEVLEAICTYKCVVIRNIPSE